MSGAKIQLSPAEGSLLTNAEVILTKNRVMAKLKTLLEHVQEDLLLQAPSFSKPHVFGIPPKISRGENCLGLPYLVLDYPRLFQQQDVFAIRSFFWWGRFFSSTLQLSGLYKETFLPKIEGAFSTFSKHYIGINTDPWQHHFEQDNYIPIAGLQHGDFKKLLYQHTHLKLATSLPVAEWEQAASYLTGNWKLFLDVLFR
jgi:hypothetical protein